MGELSMAIVKYDSSHLITKSVPLKFCTYIHVSYISTMTLQISEVWQRLEVHCNGNTTNSDNTVWNYIQKQTKKTHFELCRG